MAAVTGDQKQKLYVLAAFLGALVLVGFLVMRKNAPVESAATLPPAAAPTRGVVTTSAKPPVAAQPVATIPAKIAKAPYNKPVKAVPVKLPVLLVAKSAYIEPSRPRSIRAVFLSDAGTCSHADAGSAPGRIAFATRKRSFAVAALSQFTAQYGLSRLAASTRCGLLVVRPDLPWK